MENSLVSSWVAHARRTREKSWIRSYPFAGRTRCDFLIKYLDSRLILRVALSFYRMVDGTTAYATAYATEYATAYATAYTLTKLI